MNKIVNRPIDLRISQYLDENFKNSDPDSDLGPDPDSDGTVIVEGGEGFISYLFQASDGKLNISHYFDLLGSDTPEEVIAIMKQAIVFRGKIEAFGFDVQTVQECESMAVMGEKEVVFEDLEKLIAQLRERWSSIVSEAKEQCLCMEEPEN
ncbi:hypothetical protein KKF55_03935 [Patescibacteria group bacterium]|nr:hypothetical protein [Patescibacteria group bacterium]